MVVINHFFYHLGTSFFLLVTMIFLVSHGNQVFFVTKVFFAPGNKQFLLSN